MSKTKPTEQIVEAPAPPEVWIERLAAALKAVDAMDTDERSAALRYLKSRYPREWPSSDY